jgi:hypothetical protein
MRGEYENTGGGEPDGMLMLFLVPRRADDSGTVADEGDGKRRLLTSMRDLCFETDLGMSTATSASLTLHHVLALVLVSLFPHVSKIISFVGIVTAEYPSDSSS